MYVMLSCQDSLNTELWAYQNMELHILWHPPASHANPPRTCAPPLPCKPQPALPQCLRHQCTLTLLVPHNITKKKVKLGDKSDKRPFISIDTAWKLDFNSKLSAGLPECRTSDVLPHLYLRNPSPCARKVKLCGMPHSSWEGLQLV